MSKQISQSPPKIRCGCKLLLGAVAIGFVGLFSGAAAGAGVQGSLCQGPGRLLDRHHRARQPGRGAAVADGRRHRGAAQHRVRHCRRLGHRQVRFSRQDLPGHPDRPAFLGLAGGGGPDLCAGVRHAGLVRPLPGRSRHPYPVRAAGHRAGHHLRHLSLCGARADPADGGPGPRRGRSRRHAGRLGLSAPSCASPCPTSNGACSMACCCATPAPWASSARCRWCRAISAA